MQEINALAATVTLWVPNKWFPGMTQCILYISSRNTRKHLYERMWITTIRSVLFFLEQLSVTGKKDTLWRHWIVQWGRSLERLEKRLRQGSSPFSHPDTFCAFPFTYLLCPVFSWLLVVSFLVMRERYQGPPLYLTVSLTQLTINMLVLARSHYVLFCCVLAIKDGHYIDFRKAT